MFELIKVIAEIVTALSPGTVGVLFIILFLLALAFFAIAYVCVSRNSQILEDLENAIKQHTVQTQEFRDTFSEFVDKVNEIDKRHAKAIEKILEYVSDRNEDLANIQARLQLFEDEMVNVRGLNTKMDVVLGTMGNIVSTCSTASKQDINQQIQDLIHLQNSSDQQRASFNKYFGQHVQKKQEDK